VAAAVLYAVLSLVFFGQALLPGRTLSNSDLLYFDAPWSATRPADLQRPSQTAEEHDFAVHYDPWMRYSRAEFPGIPLWNPYAMAGRPYVGSAQPAVFSPFSLPAFVLPFDFSLGLIAALKLFTAAFGMYLLARALSLSPSGAFLPGLVFAYGMPLVTWIMELNVSAVWALIPWLLLATWAVVVRPGVLSVCFLTATSAAVYFAAHPESVAQAFAGASAFLILLVVRKPRQPGRRARGWAIDVGRFAAGVLWGAAIAAVAIVPFVEMVIHSSDLDERGTAVHRELPTRYLVTLMLPDYWGRGTAYLEGGLQPLGRFLYAGALPLMLALAASLRPTLERVACAAFAFACVAVAFGATPFADLANVLPGLSRTDNTRLIIVALPALALLAGWGLDDLRAATPDRRRANAVLIMAGVLLCLPMIWLFSGQPSLSDLELALRVAWGMATAPNSIDVVRLASLILWLTIAGAALLLIGLRVRRRLPAAAFTVLAIALVIVDLFRLGMGFNPATPRDRVTQPTTGAIRYLESRRPARYAAVGGALPGNLALRYRLYDARGYEFPIERRYRRVWGAMVNPAQDYFAGHSGPMFVPDANPETIRGLSFFGVADILVDPSSPPLRSKGLTPAYRGADATVYANRRALARTFVVAGQRFVDGEDAEFEAVVTPAFDARRTAIREGSGRTVPPGPPPGRARLLDYAPDRVVIAASASRPATVVLTDLWFPGWKATVDGAQADISRVDYLFRGVRVGPGAHRIVFSYEPTSWRIGRVVTALASLAFVATVALAVARRRRHAPAVRARA
jgi:hypothetical protein